MAENGRLEKEIFQPFPGTDARNFIQWKGTDVCIDLSCPCGHHGHFDGMFAYFLKCPNCGTIYEMGTQVLARKVTRPLGNESVQDLE